MPYLMTFFVQPEANGLLKLGVGIMKEEFGDIDFRGDPPIQIVVKGHMNSITSRSLMALGASHRIEINGMNVLAFGIAEKVNGHI